MSRIVTAAAINVVAERIAFGNMHGAVQLKNFRTQDILPPSVFHQGPVRAIRFSTDGRMIAFGGDDMAVNAIEISTGTGRQYRDAKGVINSVDISDTGMIVAGCGDHNTYVFRIASQRDVERLHHPLGVNHVSLTPRGHLLACAGPGGVMLWDTNDWKQFPTLEDTPIKLVRFSKDGRRLAVVTMTNAVKIMDTTHAFDVIALPIVGKREEVGDVGDIAFDYTGTRVGICRNDGVLTVWDYKLDTVMQPDFGTTAIKVWTVDFQPDGQFVPLFLRPTF